MRKNNDHLYYQYFSITVRQDIKESIHLSYHLTGKREKARSKEKQK
jgi:hypothetical protein